jgi:pSer/pThr/pTyr-binding forkhead associated (FHA) protein
MPVTCPFCQFQNEDGALFCEQCKSDLSAVPAGAPADAAAAVAGAAPAAAAPPVGEAPAVAAKLPAGAQPKLVVLRGLKINVEYPVYEGNNFVGRADEKPVDIDLDDQESPERVWSSRQHCLITYENSELWIEDLNSANGTFVNRTRVYPGQKRPLNVGDVLQVGTVQLKVKT